MRATIQFLAPAALENSALRSLVEVLRDDELVSNIQSESGDLFSNQLYSVLLGTGVPKMTKVETVRETADTETETDEDSTKSASISLEQENGELKRLVELLESSRRAELRLAIQRADSAERGCVSHQETISRLQRDISALPEDLIIAHGKLNQASIEHQQDTRIQLEMQEEIYSLRESLEVKTTALGVAEYNAAQLVILCSERVHEQERQMREAAGRAQERAQLQLEEMLSRLVEVEAGQMELAGGRLREARRGQQRLRFELITAVGREREQRSQVHYLEGQLLRAAELIAATSIQRAPGWDGHVV